MNYYFGGFSITTDNEQQRRELILQMYDHFWENISRSDEATWKIMASFAALIAAVSFVYDKIGSIASGILLMIFSFVGFWLTINQNQWFIRNMGLLSNIERKFMKGDDFGKILDKRWKSGVRIPFFNAETYWILCALYLMMALFGLFISTGHLKAPNLDSNIIYAIFIIFLAFSVGYIWHLYNRYASFKENTPGPNEPES